MGEEVLLHYLPCGSNISGGGGEDSMATTLGGFAGSGPGHTHRCEQHKRYRETGRLEFSQHNRRHHRQPLQLQAII